MLNEGKESKATEATYENPKYTEDSRICFQMKSMVSYS
jgi:hypothetical protein